MQWTAEDICPDYPEWPEHWRGLDEDIHYGEGLLAAMRPFVEHLIAQGLKKKPLRTHMDNLWLLGGEIIRDVCLHEEYHIPPREDQRGHQFRSSEGEQTNLPQLLQVPSCHIKLLRIIRWHHLYR